MDEEGQPPCLGKSGEERRAFQESKHMWGCAETERRSRVQRARQKAASRSRIPEGTLSLIGSCNEQPRLA